MIILIYKMILDSFQNKCNIKIEYKHKLILKICMLDNNQKEVMGKI